MSDHIVTDVEIVDCGYTIPHTWVNVPFGICNPKMSDHRVTQVDIWVSGTLGQHTWVNVQTIRH